MQRAISTFVKVNERLHPGMLDAFVRGGAEAIEIFCAKQHFDYTNRAHVQELAGWFKSSTVKLRSMHSPLFPDDDWGRGGAHPVNLVDPEKRQRVIAMDEVKRALEVAESIPYQYLVQHVGNPGEKYNEEQFEHAITAIEHLRSFAKSLGVMILVENIPNEISAAQKLKELIDSGRFQDVGMCYDVGHAHMGAGVGPEFAVMKPFIRSTHIHDNDAERDSHLWPGGGSIDWKLAMELIRSAPHKPPLLLELEGTDGVDVFAKMKETYEKLEKI